MTSRNVLVTGGAGYIGSHTVLALREAKWKVTIVDDLSTGSVRLIPSGVALRIGSIGDSHFMKTVLRETQPAAIVHIAGSLSAQESLIQPLKYYANNFLNSLHLIEAAVAAGVDKFIFSSTAAVYGIPDAALVSEQALTRPINPYGRSKLMIEDVLRDVAAACPLRYVTLRHFNVAGADEQGRAGRIAKSPTNLIKVVSELAAGRRNRMMIYGNDYATADGTCERDFIHVTDLAAAHVAALHYLKDGGDCQTFNCGYGSAHSVLEVLRVASEIKGRPLAYTIGPRRCGDACKVIADPRRILEHLAWTPRYDDLETILRTAIAWEESLPYPMAIA